MRTLLVTLLSVASALSAFADQVLPDLQGEALIQGLRERHAPERTLSYRRAREEMFSRIDNQNGRVTLFYTGEQYPTTGIPPEREVNTEHTGPQSRFEDARGRNRMKSDLHHLFPTPSSVNNRRGNNPFADIPDEQTEFWYRSSLAERDIPAGETRDQ
jgi:endonuclease I